MGPINQKYAGDTVGQSILIVDDEAPVRSLMRLMLVKHGYEVIEAIDGADALAKLNKSLPDLVILDVMMPGLSGFSVCEQIRQQKSTSHLPVIMLSAKTDPVSIAKGMRAGATKYLKKPVSAEELTESIRALVYQLD